jgi:Putative MetA-pathway of phenol degradation
VGTRSALICGAVALACFTSAAKADEGGVSFWIRGDACRHLDDATGNDSVRAFRQHQRRSLGFGDVIPIATLRWNAGAHNYMTYITGDVPVGAYDSTRLSNIGVGHGAIDAGGGAEDRAVSQRVRAVGRLFRRDAAALVLGARRPTPTDLRAGVRSRGYQLTR